MCMQEHKPIYFPNGSLKTGLFSGNENNYLFIHVNNNLRG